MKSVGPAALDETRCDRSEHTLTILTQRTDIGGNASAEEAADDLADEKVKVNNVVASFRLQSTQFDKKGFLSYLKGTLPSS